MLPFDNTILPIASTDPIISSHVLVVSHGRYFHHKVVWPPQYDEVVAWLSEVCCMSTVHSDDIWGMEAGNCKRTLLFDLSVRAQKIQEIEM